MQCRILHIDMDAFFASVEILDQPKLTGKPVIVGGLGARSVVCACSYEARKYGVHSAMPMRTARELCPSAIIIRPRFERYSELSRGIFSFLEQTVPLVERTSIDEGYLDISEAAPDDDEALRLGQYMKAEVRSRFGLSASVGIAPCKFIAKIASDLRKPDALVLVRLEEVADFLAPLEVERIPGVGKVAARKLHAAGVKTIADLQRLSHEELQSMFGKWGARLHDFARGIDPRPVVTEYERKSYGSEMTFEQDVMDVSILLQTMQRQATGLADDLRKHRLLAQTVTIKVRYSNFQLISRQRTFPSPLRAAADIATVAEDLLKATEAGRRPVRLVGISVSGLLAEDRGEELPFFDTETSL